MTSGQDGRSAMQPPAERRRGIRHLKGETSPPGFQYGHVLWGYKCFVLIFCMVDAIDNQVPALDTLGTASKPAMNQSTPPIRMKPLGYLALIIIVAILILVVYYLYPKPGPLKNNATGPGISNNTTTARTSSLQNNATRSGTNNTTIAQMNLSYIYCIGGVTNGGATNSTYYASKSDTGVGSWAETTSYPFVIALPACAISNGYVYCVGGNTNFKQNGNKGYTYTKAAYYAPMSTSGVGSWQATSLYPTNGYMSCNIYNDYIYCVGGGNLTNVYDSSYYAHVSSSGIGAWNKTTAYPNIIEGESCVISNGYIYCTGGSSPGNYINSFYAHVSSSGIGAWNKTTAYPIGWNYYPTCMAYGNYIYCVGGGGGNSYVSSTYYAALSNSGIGAWQQTSSYPVNATEQSQCVSTSGYIYCAAGYGNYLPFKNVYYASVSGAGIGAWQQTTAYPINADDGSCV